MNGIDADRRGKWTDDLPNDRLLDCGDVVFGHGFPDFYLRLSSSSAVGPLSSP
jgi:hypothetical protein